VHVVYDGFEDFCVIIEIVPSCRGASEEAIKQSDIRCYIPMVGMVESFNVSVAAGILLYHAARDRFARSVSLLSFHFEFE
jgi:hypothetical protein